MDLEDKVKKALDRGMYHEESVTNGIIRICTEHFRDLELHNIAEIRDLRQQVEELEIELMLLQNDFDRPIPVLNFKKWR